MEILIFVAIALVLGAIGTYVFKFYLKNHFPGVYQMIYQPEDFDKALEQIKTGFKA